MCFKQQSCVKIVKSRLLPCAVAIQTILYLATLTPNGGPRIVASIGPVKVKISHFLVSNVPSKFYRLDLLLLLLLLLLLDVFFLLNSNSNHQQFQSSDSDVDAVWCHDGRSQFFKTRNVDKKDFPVISTPNKSIKYFITAKIYSKNF